MVKCFWMTDLKIIKVKDAREVELYVDEIVRVVSEGGLIIYPTDTVYGLGCDPFNTHAVRKVYVVKRRKNKPLPVLASSISSLERIVVIPDWLQEVYEYVWPGPVTLILPRKQRLPDIVTLGRENVAVRIPGLDLTLKIIEACGGLLIGTSANISGHPPPRNAQQALREIGQMVDLIVDGGPSPLGEPSTIIMVDERNQNIEVLRYGALKGKRLSKLLEMIRNVIKK